MSDLLLHLLRRLCILPASGATPPGSRSVGERLLTVLGAAIILSFGLHLAYSYAQSVLDPRPLAAACAYSTSPPTVATATFVYVQCDSTGTLLVHP